MTPLSGRDCAQDVIAGWLLVLIALFFVTVFVNRRLGISPSRYHDVSALGAHGPDD